MADSLAAVVLAAGAGTRLRPLTLLRPKPLCPVAGVCLLDAALARARTAAADMAVNVHHGRAAIEAHLAGRAHVSPVYLSIEAERPLGTAGALGRLRPWIAGRPVLVVNADAWTAADLGPFAAGWDGERVRLLVVDDPGRGDFGSWRYAGAALLPWSEVAPLPDEPAGLYERSWARAESEGRLDLVAHPGPFFDCGTPGEYLDANLAASGGAPVVGEGAVVEGTLERSVVWPWAVVHRTERLVDAVRAGGGVTVLVRRPRPVAPS